MGWKCWHSSIRFRTIILTSIKTEVVTAQAFKFKDLKKDLSCYITGFYEFIQCDKFERQLAGQAQ